MVVTLCSEWQSEICVGSICRQPSMCAGPGWGILQLSNIQIFPLLQLIHFFESRSVTSFALSLKQPGSRFGSERLLRKLHLEHISIYLSLFHLTFSLLSITAIKRPSFTTRLKDLLPEFHLITSAILGWRCSLGKRSYFSACSDVEAVAMPCISITLTAHFKESICLSMRATRLTSPFLLIIEKLDDNDAMFFRQIRVVWGHHCLRWSCTPTFLAAPDLAAGPH